MGVQKKVLYAIRYDIMKGQKNGRTRKKMKWICKRTRKFTDNSEAVVSPLSWLEFLSSHVLNKRWTLVSVIKRFHLNFVLSNSFDKNRKILFG